MKPWVTPAVVLALIALGAVGIFMKYERVPDKEWIGPSGEARRDPFLATQRLAMRMGKNTRPVRALPELDRLAPTGVLLLPARRQAIDPRRLQRLVSWVEAGGHLIAEAELLGVSDPLFDLLGVQRRSGSRALQPPLVETGAGRKLKVSLASRIVLRAPPGRMVFSAGAPDAALIASFKRGQGTATVVSSFAFARNDLIGTDDNAEFLWYLVELAPGNELHVYLRQERLSLLAFLQRHAAPVLLASAALLVLWLWHIGPRFGPVLPDAPPARRRLLDHLRASGRYYWTKGLRSRMVVTARDAALRSVARAHPDFAAGTAEARTARLSDLVSIPMEQAARFIGASDAASGVEFVELMRTAQRVHRAMQKGSR